MNRHKFCFVNFTYCCFSFSVLTLITNERRERESADLLHQDGESLILEGFGELNILSTLIVDGERSHNHIGQTSQQLPHHPVPLLLITVVHLWER